MPQGIAENSRIQAVEKDRMSGLILSKLYPEAKVFVKGFEQTREIRDNSVDLVVSNFPFGETRIFDARHKDYSGFSIHNYFFARSIDALKPGGLLVAITSHYTLDSAGTDHRKYLAGKADFVGGLRLPGTAFEKTAGTEVTTDILIFRKKDASNFKGESFIDTRPVDVSEKDEQGKPQAAYVNEYFVQNPSMVLGKHSLKGTMYAKDTYTLLPLGRERTERASARRRLKPSLKISPGKLRSKPSRRRSSRRKGPKKDFSSKRTGRYSSTRTGG